MILIGYVLAKARVIDQVAGRGITLFVFNLAIPAFPSRRWPPCRGGSGTVEPVDRLLRRSCAAWIAAALVSRAIPAIAASGGAAASMAAGFGNLALLVRPPLASCAFRPADSPFRSDSSSPSMPPSCGRQQRCTREFARHSGDFSLLQRRALGWMLATNAIILGLLAAVSGISPGSAFTRSSAACSRCWPMPACPRRWWRSAFRSRLFAEGIMGRQFALIVIKWADARRRVPARPPCRDAAAAVDQGGGALWRPLPTGANAFLFAQRK